MTPNGMDPTSQGPTSERLIECLKQIQTVISECLSPPQSPTSSSPTPTPTTRPEASSETTTTIQMMTMMRDIFETQAKETRELVVTILQGRVPTGPPVTMQIESASSTRSDDDWGNSGPLPPGIEAILDREAEESQLRALQRERLDYQQRIQDLEAQRLSQMAEQHLGGLVPADLVPADLTLHRPAPS